LSDDKGGYELLSGAFSGHPSGISRDDYLDNATLHWLTDTGIPSAHLYWENKFDFFNIKRVTRTGGCERILGRTLPGAKELV
jgi:hypothetical protein